MNYIPLVCVSIVAVCQTGTLLLGLRMQRKLLELLRIRGEMVDVQAQHIKFLNSVLARLGFHTGAIPGGTVAMPNEPFTAEVAYAVASKDYRTAEALAQKLGEAEYARVLKHELVRLYLEHVDRGELPSPGKEAK